MISYLHLFLLFLHDIWKRGLSGSNQAVVLEAPCLGWTEVISVLGFYIQVKEDHVPASFLGHDAEGFEVKEIL